MLKVCCQLHWTRNTYSIKDACFGWTFKGASREVNWGRNPCLNGCLPHPKGWSHRQNENGERKNKLDTSILLPLLLTTDAVTNAYPLIFPIKMGCYLFKPGTQTNPSSSCFCQVFVRTTRKATNTHPDYALKCKIHGNVGSRYFCVEYIFICFSTSQSYEVFI